MMNFLAKSLVLVHTVLSLLALCWALMVYFNGRDYGFIEPFKEVLEYNSEGGVKSALLHASDIDKSMAALTEAGKTRDRTYAHVKPALDSMRATEPYLAANHLFYRAELKRLRESKDPIEVKRQKLGGFILETPHNLGKGELEPNALADIKKSHKAYQEDAKRLFKEIDDVDEEARKIIDKTKAITAQMTGTNEKNEYVQPGLYQLIDLEFKTQAQIKLETDEIKPFWSKAVEQSRLFQYRRSDLEATLEKLKRVAPPLPKK